MKPPIRMRLVTRKPGTPNGPGAGVLVLYCETAASPTPPMPVIRSSGSVRELAGKRSPRRGARLGADYRAEMPRGAPLRRPRSRRAGETALTVVASVVAWGHGGEYPTRGLGRIARHRTPLASP